jgi:hypothetical protein
MKVFSVCGLLLGILSTVFGIVDQNFLLILSSVSLCGAFCFLFYYYRNKSEKFIKLFSVFLAIYIVLSLVRLFTEKGYF